MSNKYLALLRGINVGGNNIISKEDLKQCFEDMGYLSVKTYIQSGNILFRTTSRSINKITKTVEGALADRFDYEARAVVISEKDYISAVDDRPKTWGESNDFKHNAMFTLKEISPQEVLDQLDKPKPTIDKVATAKGVIFWSTSKEELSKSVLMKLAKTSLYKKMTVRNHNTVFKLLDLFGTI